MKQYWPMAIAMSDGKPILLHTYDSCLSIESCERVFLIWQDAHHYTILSTWIQVTDDGNPRSEIKHKIYVDAIGQLERLK